MIVSVPSGEGPLLIRGLQSKQKDCSWVIHDVVPDNVSLYSYFWYLLGRFGSDQSIKKHRRNKHFHMATTHEFSMSAVHCKYGPFIRVVDHE